MDILLTRAQSEEGNALGPDMRGRPGRLGVESASAITRRITTLTVLTAVVLALGKAIIFLSSGSVGVLASLVHSALDMTGAVASFFAVRFAAVRPSGAYQYGRGKAEGVAAVFQMCLVVLASFHLFQESAGHLFDIAGHSHPDLSRTGLAALGMSALAAVTLWLVVAQSWAVRATGSLAVRGDRAHYTADLLASVVVVVGLLLSELPGLHWVDAALGVAFAAWLLWTAIGIGRAAWAQLMDVELPDDERAYLVGLARRDARVQAVSRLRTREAGPHVLIQMQVDVDETLSLSDAHAICVGVERRIQGVYGAADVSVVPHPVQCSVHGAQEEMQTGAERGHRQSAARTGPAATEASTQL